MTVQYPSSPSERTRWIIERRGARAVLAAERPYAWFLEQELTDAGTIANVATVLLTNRECPWKCLMCDLWRHTTESKTLPGSIVAQLRFVMAQLGPASVLKLYNSGSFFDPAAIPRADWDEIAELCRGFDQLIVECHPRLVNSRIEDFRSILPCALEVALGLETAHPSALEALNKRVTIRDYQTATAFLIAHGIGVRTFLLVNPPFIPEVEQETWVQLSIELAFDSGSSVVSLIPLRSGNGAIDQLIRRGEAAEPSLQHLEVAQEWGIGLGRGRVFADTWELARFSRCDHCLPLRTDRIHRMNLSQTSEPRIDCSSCGDH